MKFTISWLKEHLDTKFKDNKIIEKLTDIGLEVENFGNVGSELDSFKVAKIINAEQHPNADRLRVCDVDIGEKNTVKVVCGAPNAKKNLLTVYAGPGSIIPKNKMKLNNFILTRRGEFVANTPESYVATLAFGIVGSLCL